MGVKESYIILYPPGAYGYFMGWFVTWLSGTESVYRPWEDETKTAHAVDLPLFLDYKTMLDSPVISGSISNLQIDDSIDIVSVIDQTTRKYDKCIYLQPTKDSLLWYMNRRFSKTNRSSFFVTHEKWFGDSMKAWTTDELAIWQKRECLSYFFRQWIVKELDMDVLDQYQNSNLMVITMPQIRDDLVGLSRELSIFLNIPMIRTNEELQTLQSEFLERQEDMHKDKTVSDVILALLEGHDMDMPDLSILDQSEIQRILRDEHGLNMRCFDLDEWPKTTGELSVLLYKT